MSAGSRRRIDRGKDVKGIKEVKSATRDLREVGRARLVLLAILLTAGAAAAQVPAAPPALTPATRVTRPFTGITFIDRIETAPRVLHMRVVQIDLSAPGLRFELSAPSGSRETVRQPTARFLEERRAQLAINAHFFLPWPTTDSEVFLVGIAASNGRVFSGFETPEQRYAIVVDSPGLNIDRQNRASIVHRDTARADGTGVRENVELWTTVSGSAQIVTNGKATVPVYRDAAHPSGELIAGGPRDYSSTNNWYELLNARTSIGLSRDSRTLTLFTVDVRGGSEGMRVGEVAERLIADYGVWNALNLDGGGSTSLAMTDPITGAASIVNASSDNPAGRSVGSSLAVFARASGTAYYLLFGRGPTPGR